MKIRLLLIISTFFYISLSFAQEIKIRINDRPGSLDSKIELGDRVEIKVTGDHWVSLEIDRFAPRNPKVRDWTKKQITLSRTVDKHNTDSGSMYICYSAKDDDGIGMTPTLDYDTHDCIILKTSKVTFKPDPTPAGIDTIEIRKNGKVIDSAQKIRLGDKISVKVTSKYWADLEIDRFAPRNPQVQEWTKKKITLSRTVDKHNTDSGSMYICYSAKDDDGISTVSGLDYDSHDCILLETLHKTFIPDNTPGKIRSVEVSVNPSRQSSSGTKKSSTSKQ